VQAATPTKNLRNSVLTGVSLVNIRLSPSSTSDFYFSSFIKAKSVVLEVLTP